MITTSSDQTPEFRRLSLSSPGVLGELINKGVYLRGGCIIRIKKALRTAIASLTEIPLTSTVFYQSAKVMINRIQSNIFGGRLIPGGLPHDPPSSLGRFSLALELGREKALASAGHMTTKHPEFVGVLN